MNKKERKNKIENQIKVLEGEKRVYVRGMNSKLKENEKAQADIISKQNKINDKQLRINLGGVKDSVIIGYENDIKVLEQQISRLKKIIEENNAQIDEYSGRRQPNSTVQRENQFY